MVCPSCLSLGQVPTLKNMYFLRLGKISLSQKGMTLHWAFWSQPSSRPSGQSLSQESMALLPPTHWHWWGVSGARSSTCRGWGLRNGETKVFWDMCCKMKTAQKDLSSSAHLFSPLFQNQDKTSNHLLYTRLEVYLPDGEVTLNSMILQK